MHGRWRTDERGYVAALRRYASEIGQLAWCAPMDHMTEAHILSRTGGTVLSHQQRTFANYLRLRDLAPDLPIIPVLQGQSLSHQRCAGSYERHGVNLAALPLVGVGSVCRRQHTAEVEQILRSLAARGYRLHAFGAKVLGLGRFADAIASSDSAAWSFRGRYVPGCMPSHRSESNCQRFALAWHARLQTSLVRHEEAPQRRDPVCNRTTAVARRRPLKGHAGRVVRTPRPLRPAAAAHNALAVAARSDPQRTGVHHAHH
ncbi:deazapurine DNA modification protein DpdA family protein [Amycolatopsis panacis]|uniref:deazapurine DNA modification protein DpdA family protein n=1 Tax=Amycolatopsis panacis TaxID=2340917 RepID=UPI001F2F344D|nr:hypothetical protein [Amycolatopsis panacis]